MRTAVVIVISVLVVFAVQTDARAINYSGKVVNDIGRPAYNATITVRNLANPNEEYTAVTDTTGLFSFVITDVAGERRIPFRLYGNFPNPFNPCTRISYSLDGASDVKITIYNILGQIVRSIEHGYREPGYYTAIWDGTDDSGEPCSAGVYLYRLDAGGRSLTAKMLMVDSSTGSWINANSVPKAAFKTSGDILYVVTVSHPDAKTLTLGPLTINATTDTLLVIERIMTKMELVHHNTYTRGTDKRYYPHIYPAHRVRITHDFLMDKYEVTTALYCEMLNRALARGEIVVEDGYVKNVVGDSQKLVLVDTPEKKMNVPIVFSGDGFAPKKGMEKIPVSFITWYGAMFYCYERNVHEGFPQAVNITDWSCDIKSTGYRLPTDAEWELAARWTDDREYAFGPDPGHYKPMNVQLNDDGFDNVLSPVGWFSPQGDSHDGICDLSGNVYEWVLDWQGLYDPSWVDSVLVDPTGPETGLNKVCRGGSAQGCFRSARTYDKANIFIADTLMNIGFRTIRVLKD